MPDKTIKEKKTKRKGIQGFIAKVLNEAGTALVDLYDLGEGAVNGLCSISKKTTSKLSNTTSKPSKTTSKSSKKTKPCATKKSVESLYPDKTKLIKDCIKVKEEKIKEIYQEIGKEEAKSKQIDSVDEVDPQVSDNIRKLTSDVKEFEEQISRLEQKATILKKEKIESKDKKIKLKQQQREIQKQDSIRKRETQGLSAEDAVKAAIASSLKSGKFSSGSEKSKFEKVANDLLSEDHEVRILAANELAKMKNEAAVPVLTESVRTGDSNLTSEIINALITIGSVNSVPLFKEMVTDRNHRIRVACLRGLYKLAEDDDEAMQLLVDAVKDEHPEVRKCAITFIGWKDNAESVPSLVQALRDDHDDVKKTALDALATIRDKATVLPVIRVLGDNDENIREKALETLKMITGEQISFDMQASGDELTDAVDNLIDWWQKKRTGEGEIFISDTDETVDLLSQSDTD
ncbi:MAG: HEAT repeat domain-containing protein [Desulfamplus sp.]|nr:HEAT repeat domain-containing protein [Desulfamplus sp.]